MPQSRSGHRDNPPLSPESYVFRRLRRHTAHIKGGQLLSPASADRYSGHIGEKQTKLYEPQRTPKTYEFKRMSIDRRREKDAHDEMDRNSIDNEDHQKLRPVPQSYRFSTKYPRAEPSGTYKPQQGRKPSEERTISSSSSERPRVQTSCDCLFYLYNGFCNGHEQIIPYYNVRSLSDPRLVPYTTNMRHDVTMPTVSRYDTGANLDRIGCRVIEQDYR
jgi:hypothetical protein